MQATPRMVLASFNGIGQLQSYMSVCPNCEWGMWTNSVQKFVFRKVVDEAGNISFMEYNDIPSADGNLDDVNRPSRKSLKNASDDNLLFVFKTCHNHIYINDGMQKQPAFFELLKVIFCKIEDERNIPTPLEFYTTSEERSNPDGQLTVQKRISKIFQRVKKRHGKILLTNSYGAVITHIEPEHLATVPIPDAPASIKKRVNDLILGCSITGITQARSIRSKLTDLLSPLARMS